MRQIHIQNVYCDTIVDNDKICWDPPKLLILTNKCFLDIGRDMLSIRKSTPMHSVPHETHTHTHTHKLICGTSISVVVLACLDCQESLFLPQSPLFPSWVWASESLLLGEKLSELEVFTWVDVIDLDRLFVHLPPGYAHKPELYLALTITLTDETINLKLYKNKWTLGKPELKNIYFYTYFHNVPQIMRKKLSMGPAYDINV